MKKREKSSKNLLKEDENTPKFLSDPEAIYKTKGLKKFDSFEAANEADAEAKANLAPEQHLLNATKRIKEMYADELKRPMDKNLKFRND